MTVSRQIVLSGKWLYDRTVPMPVHIIRTSYDYLYELAKSDGQLEPGEQPSLNEDGFRFDLLFRDEHDATAIPHDFGGLTIDEAKRRAEQVLPSPVRWDDAL